MYTTLHGHDVLVGTGGLDWQAGQPTLMMIHGAGLNRSVWVLLARYFARHGYNIVAPDLPAHGNSGGTVLSTIEAQGQWCNELLEHLVAQAPDALTLDTLLYVGHSMGSLTALEAASQHSESTGLLLLASGYPMVVGEALLDAARDNDHAAIDMIVQFGHSLASQLGHNAVAGISVFHSAIALLEQAAPGVLHTDLNACNEYRGGEAAAERLLAAGTRSAMLIGDADRMTMRKGSLALAALLDITPETLGNCGHMLMSEQPEATLQGMRRELSAMA